jgi:hypothetical protein
MARKSSEAYQHLFVLRLTPLILSVPYCKPHSKSLTHNQHLTIITTAKTIYLIPLFSPLLHFQNHYFPSDEVVEIAISSPEWEIYAIFIK